jgi:hypothetical protein
VGVAAALEIRADASAGEIVAVLVVTLAVAVSVAVLSLELEEPDPESDDVLPLLRTSWPRDWGCVSMKARVGPATSWVVARSTTSRRSG